MAESWICNASPLIALSQIGRLDLIAALADRVLVPATVIAEVAAGGQGNDTDDQVRESPLVEVIADVAVPERVANWRLDAGETQVLAHALTRTGAGVVLDDWAARRCARLLAIPMTGTIGLVALAKRKGILVAAAPVLAALQEAGLRVAPALVQSVLSELGETA